MGQQCFKAWCHTCTGFRVCLLLQGQIAQLQGQVGEVGELVSRSSDAAGMAATQGLQQLAGLQTANAQQVHQVRCSVLISMVHMSQL